MAGGPFITEQKRKRVIEIHESTMFTQQEIANVLRISQNAVSRILKEGNDRAQSQMETDSSVRAK